MLLAIQFFHCEKIPWNILDFVLSVKYPSLSATQTQIFSNSTAYSVKLCQAIVVTGLYHRLAYMLVVNQIPL